MPARPAGPGSERPRPNRRRLWAMVLPVDVTLARAKCPRCGHVVVAASPVFKDSLCRAHDLEVHGITRPAATAERSAASKVTLSETND